MLCFQIYEFLLYCTQHSDHNVVTATLETLQQLLRTPPPPLHKLLLTRGGITHKTVFEEDDGKSPEDTEDSTGGKFTISFVLMPWPLLFALKLLILDNIVTF